MWNQPQSSVVAERQWPIWGSIIKEYGEKINRCFDLKLHIHRKSTWESIHQALTPRGNSKNTTTTTTITRAIFRHVGCCLSQTALAHWWFKTSYLVWARFPFDSTLFDFSFLFVFNFSTLLCVHCILDECTQQFAFAHLCDLPVTCSCALVCLFCLSTH